MEKIIIHIKFNKLILKKCLSISSFQNTLYSNRKLSKLVLSVKDSKLAVESSKYLLLQIEEKGLMIPQASNGASAKLEGRLLREPERAAGQWSLSNSVSDDSGWSNQLELIQYFQKHLWYIFTFPYVCESVTYSTKHISNYLFTRKPWVTWHSNQYDITAWWPKNLFLLLFTNTKVMSEHQALPFPKNKLPPIVTIKTIFFSEWWSIGLWWMWCDVMEWWRMYFFWQQGDQILHSSGQKNKTKQTKTNWH